jgi:hypothetical protein
MKLCGSRSSELHLCCVACVHRGASTQVSLLEEHFSFETGLLGHVHRLYCLVACMHTTLAWMRYVAGVFWAPQSHVRLGVG